MIMISPEEQLMYQVMQAIYKSKIPISFKGSLVLKACLIEAGYSEEMRHTVDIDANWNSDTTPTTEQIINSLQQAITKEGLSLHVCLYREFGKGRSAGLELSDENSGETLFTMDIDVNRPVSSTKIYEIAGIYFLGAAPTQILADKLSVVSSDRVFRRIKDVIDLYYLSRVFLFEKLNVLSSLKISGRTLGNFNAFLYKSEELKHSYDKFRFAGNVPKPSFDVVYKTVKLYIKDILPKEKSIVSTKTRSINYER
jgi:hypothetical protein